MAKLRGQQRQYVANSDNHQSKACASRPTVKVSAKCTTTPTMTAKKLPDTQRVDTNEIADQNFVVKCDVQRRQRLQQLQQQKCGDNSSDQRINHKNKTLITKPTMKSKKLSSKSSKCSPAKRRRKSVMKSTGKCVGGVNMRVNTGQSRLSDAIATVDPPNICRYLDFLQKTDDKLAVVVTKKPTAKRGRKPNPLSSDKSSLLPMKPSVKVTAIKTSIKTKDNCDDISVAVNDCMNSNDRLLPKNETNKTENQKNAKQKSQQKTNTLKTTNPLKDINSDKNNAKKVRFRAKVMVDSMDQMTDEITESVDKTNKEVVGSDDKMPEIIENVDKTTQKVVEKVVGSDDKLVEEVVESAEQVATEVVNSDNEKTEEIIEMTDKTVEDVFESVEPLAEEEGALNTNDETIIYETVCDINSDDIDCQSDEQIVNSIEAQCVTTDQQIVETVVNETVDTVKPDTVSSQSVDCVRRSKRVRKVTELYSSQKVHQNGRKRVDHYNHEVLDTKQSDNTCNDNEEPTLTAKTTTDNTKPKRKSSRKTASKTSQPPIKKNKRRDSINVKNIGQMLLNYRRPIPEHQRRLKYVETDPTIDILHKRIGLVSTRLSAIDESPEEHLHS